MCCLVCSCVFVFFFKQKTAYEMRISDWSSDVCSSDLAPRRRGQQRLHALEAVGGVDSGLAQRGLVELFQVAYQHIGFGGVHLEQIGRASCRERVCQYV